MNRLKWSFLGLGCFNQILALTTTMLLGTSWLVLLTLPFWLLSVYFYARFMREDK